MTIVSVLFYATPLVVPPAYFMASAGKQRRYSAEMVVGFVLQLFWTLMVWVAVRHYALSGNRDALEAWYYLVPVNVIGICYFATMPFWTFYKKPNSPNQSTNPTP
jgi:hypothetical protein